MSAKYKSPSFLLPNELNTSANTANDTGINSLYSMDFDGLNDYIDIGSQTFNPDNSISFWINPSTSSNYGTILSASSSYSISIDEGGGAIGVGKFYFRINNVNYIVSSTALAIGTWSHVVFATNGTNVYCYINGVLDKTTTVPAYSTWRYIGAQGAGSGNLLTGKLDEVAIFNRALNTTEIAALYDGTGSNIRPSNLIASNLNPIAYYPLGEQAQNTGYVGSGDPGNPTTLSNVWQFPNGVLQDYVMDFDSTSPGDYISAPMTMLNSATQCTISFWGKKDASNKILCIGDQITNSQGIWLMWYSDGNIYFSPRGTGGSNFGLTYAQPYDNNWHHYLAVYNGSSATNCKLYLDGDLVATGSGTAPSSLPAATGNAFKIGALISSSFYSDGQISNVAVWNTAITDANQIANIYNNGSPQTTYTVTPQNWWKLNATSVYTPSAPNYTTALDFGGTDYIDCGIVSAVENVSSFSMSVWVYPTNGSVKSVIGNWGNPYVGVDIATSSGAVYFTVDSDTGGSGYGATPSGLSNSNWAHLVLVFDGSGSGDSGRLKGYINGVEQTLSYTGTIPATTAAPNRAFRIGDQHVGNGLIGNISNAAIFDSALTSTQVSTLFNFGTPETAISFSPTSWWKLDNLTTGLLDSGSASNNGTNNGATDATTSVAVVPSWKIPSALPIATPNYTTALDFNGSSDYIDTNYSITSGNKTISFWFNSSYAGYQCVMGNTNDSFILGSFTSQLPLPNGISYMQGGSSKQFGVTASVTDEFADGQWHHFVYTYDGNSKIYIDGTERTISYKGGTTSSDDIVVVSNLALGLNRASYPKYSGKLSNTSIWNTALTSSQVSTLFNNGTPETSISFSPISWWKLDTGGSTITDYGSGGNNGTNTGAAQVTSDVLASQPVNGVSTTLPSTALQQSDLQFDSPYSNYSLSFDGTGDYIAVTQDFSSYTSMSVSGWVKTTSTSQFQYLFSTGVYNGGAPGNGQGFGIGFDNTGKFAAWAGGANYFTFGSFSTNTWYHITQTITGTTLKFYVNGVLTSTQTVGALNIPSSAIAVIGGYSGNATPTQSNLYGKADELSIFNYALSSAQILEIYNNGKPNDLNNFSGTVPTNWWRLGENAYFDNNSFVVPNSITGAPNGTGSGTITTMISADAPGTYANGIGTNLDILDRVGEAPLSTSNSQSYNMIPSDISPYVPSYVGDQIANAASMTFDGVDSFFDTGNIDLGINSTLTLWFKPGTSPVVNDYALIGEGSNGFHYVIRKQSGAFYVWVGSSFHNYGSAITTNINANGWNFLAVQKAGDTITVYLKNTNGEFEATATISGWATTSMTFDRIGARTTSPAAQAFSGQIDEVAGFSEALTRDQIKFDLYQPSLPLGSNKTADIANNPNLPTPVAWYRMGD